MCTDCWSITSRIDQPYCDKHYSGDEQVAFGYDSGFA